MDRGASMVRWRRRDHRQILGRVQRVADRCAPPAGAQARSFQFCFTDDRYADDIHYMGGCLLNDNLWWGATMLAYQARPPDPRIAGERWRTMWRQIGLFAMPFWPASG